MTTPEEQIEGLRLKHQRGFGCDQIRAKARTLALNTGLAVPEWCARKRVPRSGDPATRLERLRTIAVNATSSVYRASARTDARKLCAVHALVIPDWAIKQPGGRPRAPKRRPDPAPKRVRPYPAPPQHPTPRGSASELPTPAIEALRSWRSRGPNRSFSARSDRVVLTEYVHGIGERRAQFGALDLAVAAASADRVPWNDARTAW